MSLHFTLRLATSRMIAPTVRHLAFERVDGQALAFVPGQFLQVHFEVDGRALRRSYSIATLPGDPANPRGLIEIAVSYVEGGSATRLLAGLAEGETLEASGPYGRFVLHAEDANQRYLLIATGTGVTPYRAMLPQLGAQIAARGIEVALLLGARTRAELLYAEEFRAFATATPGFRFHPCLSREGSAQPHADERRGRVQAMLVELAPDPARDIAYLCGNPEMVDACFALLKDAGLAIPVIRREKYVSPPDPKARSAGLAIVTE